MLGYTAGGWCQYEAYRPTVKSFSDEVAEARKAKLNPSARVCLPHGWDFDITNGKGFVRASMPQTPFPFAPMGR